MSECSVYGDLNAILVWPSPIVEPRPRLAWPMAPTHAAVAAILHTHAARIWGPIPVDPLDRWSWWSQWTKGGSYALASVSDDPYAELRTELAGYAPDKAAVTLAGIRALAGAS